MRSRAISSSSNGSDGKARGQLSGEASKGSDQGEFLPVCFSLLFPASQNSLQAVQKICLLILLLKVYVALDII